MQDDDRIKRIMDEEDRKVRAMPLRLDNQYARMVAAQQARERVWFEIELERAFYAVAR